MRTVRRNDPCPCGSGKKYKKCCGAAALQSPYALYERIRRLDGEASDLLVRFSKLRYGDDALEQAWMAFWFLDETPLDSSHPEYEFFLRWFVLDWRPDGIKRLAEAFLSERGSTIDTDMRRFLNATLDAPYSFFQTLDAEPGVGLELRDILRRRDFRVMERSASSILEKSHILYARVVEQDGIAFLMGNGFLVIPPSSFSSLLDLRADLIREEDSTVEAVESETLLNREDDLREVYFELADQQRNRRLDIRNTDGDPLLLHTLRYTISSFEGTFHALKDLELKVTRRPEQELIEEGEPAKAFVHWLRKRKTTSGEESITIATLKIADSTLVVEANSEKRAKRVQKEITKRLGKDAVYIGTTITSTEGIFKQSAGEGANAQKGETEHKRLMRQSPEARRMIKQYMEKHWAVWPDTALPALRGMTPRQAAKEPLGRELLESLLLDFESRNNAETDEYQRVDVEKLRKELGMK